jgi:PAS domain-containing protein
MGYIAPGAACVEVPRRLPNAFPPMKSATSHKMQDGRIFLRLGLWLAVGGTLAAGLLFVALLVAQGGELVRRDDAPAFYALGAIALSLALGAWGALRLAYRTREVDATLRERERDLEMAQAGGRIGSVIIDLARGEWVLSRVGYEVLGVPGGSWRPLAEFAAMLAPHSRAEAVKRMQANIGSGGRTSAEYEIVRQLDGKHAWIRVMTDTEFDADGKPLRRIGTVQDITEEKAAAARIVRLSRLYAALSKTNEAVMRSTDFNRLCEQACRIAVEEGGMVSATIRIHDRAAGTLVRVAGHGPVDGLVGRPVIAVDDSIGLAGATFRDGRRNVIERMAEHSLTRPSARDAARQGISAMACFPLRTQDTVFGTFSLFAGSSTDLDERTIDLLEEIAGAIAFARAKMDAEQRIERPTSFVAKGRFCE